MTGQSAIDQVINARGAQLERWLESPESLSFWGLLGFMAVALLALYLIGSRIEELFEWSTRSWKRVVLLPVYLLVMGCLLVFLYRLGVSSGLMPEALRRALEGAVGL